MQLKLEKNRILTDDGNFHYSYLSRSYYLEQLSNYEKYFKPNNIKIVLFEELIKNTETIINEISDFIGLPSYEYVTTKISNPASNPRFEFIQRFIYQKNGLKKMVGILIPSKERKRKIMQGLEKLNLKMTQKKTIIN